MRLTLLVATLAVSTAVLAQKPAALDRTAAAMSGTEASFTQKFTPRGFKNSQVETGTVVFGSLPKMRWSYSKPEQKLFVFDGDRSWFYVPGDKQVTVGQLDDSRRAELPFLLIGDPAARAKNFKLTEKSLGGRIVTSLQPKNASALIRNVSITTNATTNRIERVEYSDRDGNRTTFDLAGYHPRPATADTFRFTPPAGVQVVDAN